MNPNSKTILYVVSTLLCFFIVPTILVIFHEYIYAFFAIFFFIASFVVFGIGSYDELYPMILKKQQEEDDIIHSFGKDKEKIRFYKAFKKYFDGDLSSEGLKEYLINHPSKH